METEHLQLSNYPYQQQQGDSVSQTYVPSTQAYTVHRPYPHPHQNDYEYSYYYPAPDYSNSYQYHQLPNDSLSIHPPGVPITQQHLQNHQNEYYPPQQSQLGYLQSGPAPALNASSSQSVRPTRRGGRANSGASGRGRGRGRGKHGPPYIAASSVQDHVAPARQSPRMAWCELCRVDCTTPEILEQHKNGKKHKKNLKASEEQQILKKVSTTKKDQEIPVCGVRPELPQPGKLEGTENTTSVAATQVNASAKQPEKDAADKPETSGARVGVKRNRLKGGRGGKSIRTQSGSRRLVQSPKPKQMTPLVCELCNVKCESQSVFDTHLAGKKHLSKIKRLQGHVAALGGRVEELYPPVSHVASTALPQVGHGLQNSQVLASTLLAQQGVNDAGACQAALTQLLLQHGIQDPQTLLAQLIPILLAQAQGAVAAPGPSELPAGGALAVEAAGQSAAVTLEGEGHHQGENKNDVLGREDRQQQDANDASREGEEVKTEDGRTELDKSSAKAIEEEEDPEEDEESIE